MKIKKYSIFAGALILNVSSFANGQGEGPGELANRLGLKVVNLADYRVTTAAKKTFSIKGDRCSSEVKTYVAGAEAGISTVIRKRFSGTNFCDHKVFHVKVDSKDRRLIISRDNYNLNIDANGDLITVLSSTDSINGTLVTDPGMIMVGASWGSGTSLTNSVTPKPKTHIVEKRTLLEAGLTVTVTAGTFTNCVKIHHLRTSQVFGLFNRITWRCPGVGVVKTMQHKLNTESKTFVLTNIVYK